MKNKLSKLIVTGLVIIASNAQAVGSQTGSMTVNATVTSACSFGANAALNFGTYDPSASSTGDTGTTLKVTCTAGSTFMLWSTTGQLLRQMTGAIAADVLAYKLFGDSAKTSELSVATGAGSITGTGTGLPVSVPIYGQIAAGQFVPAGAYTQSINLTMSY